MQALVLIGAVFEVQRDSVLELEEDSPIAHDFAARHHDIQDLEKAGVWPSAFFPMGHDLAVPKQVDRRLDREMDRAKRELQVELANTHLSREMADRGRQIEITGNAVQWVQLDWQFDDVVRAVK